MNENDFSRGVAAILEQRAIKRSELNRLAGFKETSTLIRDMFNRGTMPSVDKAKAISDALGISLDDIFAAGNGILPDNVRATPHPSIPRYDLRLSAGRGTLSPEQQSPRDHIPFTQEFVTKKFRRDNTRGLICAEIDGDSMEPTMSNDDLVVIDTASKKIDRGIFAVNYNGAAHAKRIQRSGQNFLLVPDNPVHPTLTIRMDDDCGFEVVGKIIWVGRNIE